MVVISIVQVTPPCRTVHAGSQMPKPALAPLVGLPRRFLTPPSLVSSGRLAAAKPSATSSVRVAPLHAHSLQDKASNPGQVAMRSSSESDQQQEDIIYVMWTSGSTGNAKAVCGTATGESSVLHRQH